MYQLVVVGAGPHALALLAKLLETEPDLQEEAPYNQRLFRTQKTGEVYCRHDSPPAALLRSTRQMARHKYPDRFQANHSLEGVQIFDGQGTWLRQWDRQFATLGITYLRSNIGAHPHPSDRDMMPHFVQQKTSRAAEVREMGLTRTEIFHGPFLLPSTLLFREFAETVIQNYHLSDMVLPGIVDKITVLGPNEVQLILRSGQQVRTAKLVLALGSLGVPVVPEWAYTLSQKGLPPDTVRMAADILQTGTLKVARGTHVLVVGGGQTAANLAVQAAKRGAKVRLVMRGTLCSKQFDLELQWMGHKRMQQLAKFWRLPLSERPAVLRQAKGGGSVTPELLTELRRLGVHLETEVEVMTAQWLSGPAKVQATFCSGAVARFDHIWLACGAVMDVQQHPLLSQLQAQAPIELINGLPAVTDDLQWRPDTPVFLMGEWSALQLGPGANNLMGARAGAARIAHALGGYLNRSQDCQRPHTAICDPDMSNSSGPTKGLLQRLASCAH